MTVHLLYFLFFTRAVYSMFGTEKMGFALVDTKNILNLLILF